MRVPWMTVLWSSASGHSTPARIMPDTRRMTQSLPKAYQSLVRLFLRRAFRHLRGSGTMCNLLSDRVCRLLDVDAAPQTYKVTILKDVTTAPPWRSESGILSPCFQRLRSFSATVPSIQVLCSVSQHVWRFRVIVRKIRIHWKSDELSFIKTNYRIHVAC